MLSNKHEKVVALNLCFEKALVRTNEGIISSVGGFCLLGSVFASLELDFLSSELMALAAAADSTQTHTINLDKAVCTKGC